MNSIAIHIIRIDHTSSSYLVSQITKLRYFSTQKWIQPQNSSLNSLPIINDSSFTDVINECHIDRVVHLFYFIFNINLDWFTIIEFNIKIDEEMRIKS